MLEHIFPKSLNLEVAEHTFRQSEVEDLEAALEERTQIGAAKATQVRALSTPALVEEAGALREMDAVLRDVFRWANRRPHQISRFLKRLDLSLISQDQDWRTIIGCLNRLDHDYDPHKKAALIHYQKYLAARLALVESLLSSPERQDADEPDWPARAPAGFNDPPEKRLSSPERQDADEPDWPARVPVAFNDPPEKLLETSSFMIPDNKPVPRYSRSFKRLPKGDTVEVRLKRQHSLRLKLAKHEFTLVLGAPDRLIDEKDHEIFVPPGKNIVGRGPTVDIRLNDEFRTVSRSHALIEIRDGGVIRLTDVSTHGTYLLEEDLPRD